MRNIIEELYYGNITPCDRDIVKGGTYSHLLHLVTRNEDDLMQTLTQATPTQGTVLCVTFFCAALRSIVRRTRVS